ncbi:hypothetical protein [Maritimibacter sp. DP1N21-5]|uniref:hypothetical protein n=1 Tax=Maritimibacter sp. DP1N21-5 TaxID=2836867 RepID=UPI001C43D01F|nr:hypothetical protein [Maritimibacter sp. DP1N21-5]MBV7407903.1 hypothetical protein [Maritimibacter sp. DP1N21-5]
MIHAYTDPRALPFDDFERGLLPVLRHFLVAMTDPGSQAWRLAYATARERWGRSAGLAIADSLGDFVACFVQRHGATVDFHDPLDPERRVLLAKGEAALLAILHHMRRDHASAARRCLALVTGGRTAARVVQAGLAFAARYPAASVPARAEPSLRVVH